MDGGVLPCDTDLSHILELWYVDPETKEEGGVQITWKGKKPLG